MVMFHEYVNLVDFMSCLVVAILVAKQSVVWLARRNIKRRHFLKVSVPLPSQHGLHITAGYGK